MQIDRYYWTTVAVQADETAGGKVNRRSYYTTTKTGPEFRPVPITADITRLVRKKEEGRKKGAGAGQIARLGLKRALRRKAGQKENAEDEYTITEGCTQHDLYANR